MNFLQKLFDRLIVWVANIEPIEPIVITDKLSRYMTDMSCPPCYGGHSHADDEQRTELGCSECDFVDTCKENS